MDTLGNSAAEWRTRSFVSAPLDDFVLDPDARIAFDVYAKINADREKHQWVIDLPAATYGVYFEYCVDRETDWYDFLAKRSRFATVTPIWRGSVRSNTIRFSVAERNKTQ